MTVPRAFSKIGSTTQNFDRRPAVVIPVPNQIPGIDKYQAYTWTMGDNAQPGSPETLDSQITRLKSSSTNIRIEALRKLLHSVQGFGTTAAIRTST